MITTSDIVDILYEACAPFEMDVFRKGYIPNGEVTSERIVILPKEQTPQTYWKKCFVEINICVPDLANGVANIERLQEVERMAARTFKEGVGAHDGSSYSFGIESMDGMSRDESLGCHYVNVRLLFEVLNVTEYETVYWN